MRKKAENWHRNLLTGRTVSANIMWQSGSYRDARTSEDLCLDRLRFLFARHIGNRPPISALVAAPYLRLTSSGPEAL
jgi:hypothetical protein